MNTALTEPELLTVPEAAALLRISTKSVYREIAHGNLPVIRFGRLIRIPRHALLTMIRSAEPSAR